MKILVESPFNAPMVDPTTSCHICALRPSVIENSVFARELISEERLTLLAELTDEASDIEFEVAHRADPAKALAGLPRPEVVKPAPKAK